MMDLRPPQPPTPEPDAFEIHRETVDGDLELAFVREGVGGYPLVLVHGYPETKRIWWRNIEPLAEAGYEVIVPDLRGHGDSALSPDDDYHIVRYGRDVHTLVHDVLGHQRYGLVGGDVGGAVMCDMANRFPDAVDKMVFFNSIAPVVVDQLDWYAERGLDLDPLGDGPTGDYRIRQGRDWRELIDELATPERRRRWVRDCYEHRLWASPGTFTEDDFAFHTEPFGDRDRLLASWAVYQLAYEREMSEAPLLGQAVTVPTLVLYGPDDRVVPADFPLRCEIAFINRVGPLVVPHCGHFVQWERADILNAAAIHFFAERR